MAGYRTDSEYDTGFSEQEAPASFSLGDAIDFFCGSHEIATGCVLPAAFELGLVVSVIGTDVGDALETPYVRIEDSQVLSQMCTLETAVVNALLALIQHPAIGGVHTTLLQFDDQKADFRVKFGHIPRAFRAEIFVFENKLNVSFSFL